MATSIFCASKISLLKLWQEKLEHFNTYIAKSKNELLEFLSDYNEPIVLIIDNNLFAKEDEKFLEKLRDSYPLVKVSVLSNKPSIKEAQNFIKLGVKGYGNSYMYKTHFQDMTETVWNNKLWFYPEFIKTFFPNHYKNSDEKSLATIKEIAHLAIIRDAQEERIAEVNDIINENETIIVPYEDSYISLNIGGTENIEIFGIDSLYFEQSVFVKKSFSKSVTLEKEMLDEVLEMLGENLDKTCKKNPISKDQKEKKAYYQGTFNQYTIKPSKSFHGYFIIEDSIKNRDGSDLIHESIEALVFQDETKILHEILPEQ